MYFFIFKKYSCIYFSWLHWVLTAAPGSLLQHAWSFVAVHWLFSRCSGFSLDVVLGLSSCDV